MFPLLQERDLGLVYLLRRCSILWRKQFAFMISSTEIVQSMLVGPALRPPDKPRRTSLETFQVLQVYPFRPLSQTPEYPVSDQLPTIPQFSWTPTAAPDPSSDTASELGDSTFALQRENTELSRLRVYKLRSDSPLRMFLIASGFPSGTADVFATNCIYECLRDSMKVIRRSPIYT
jgi:hypothetical protein